MTKSAKRKAHDANRRVATNEFTPASVNTSATPLAPPYAPVKIDAAQLAFPAGITYLMPAYDSIPDAYKGYRGAYHELFTSWFYHGIKKIEPVLRDPSMDVTTCLMHLTAVMRSFGPKHEHKSATVKFLLDTWFVAVVWEDAKEQPATSPGSGT